MPCVTSHVTWALLKFTQMWTWQFFMKLRGVALHRFQMLLGNCVDYDPNCFLRFLAAGVLAHLGTEEVYVHTVVRLFVSSSSPVSCAKDADPGRNHEETLVQLERPNLF
eukprot:1771279-Amphidinium_carterae.1